MIESDATRDFELFEDFATTDDLLKASFSLIKSISFLKDKSFFINSSTSCKTSFYFIKKINDDSVILMKIIY